jgi:hypothetical protein
MFSRNSPGTVIMQPLIQIAIIHTAHADRQQSVVYALRKPMASILKENGCSKEWSRCQDLVGTKPVERDEGTRGFLVAFQLQ